ncbi:ABC transporter ATP-binding protein [Tumebacillus sp. ITR2]|uniref:ABC transporter ATP-binding protein n=1 Tax=Tumebacillus amylolyticus TaxID=2801339 RepID=A0ABS1J7U4_9BACL|nr:ABC transporter ATP-binding protein [Tumebacillus amylolyticus]MBL0386342.1 ABC transporter ATP-binding protein [Tumebacillus amylolyticus]
MERDQQVVVEVRGLVQEFGKRRVLDDISFAVHRGEILGLLGPSGSGKTTLVKAIAAIGTYTAGEVTVLGERMPSLGKIGRIGYMAQADALYQDLTGLDNLHFFGELYGVPKKRRTERIAELLELVQLTDAAKRPVQTYSGGMKRRLSLAVALLHQPELLILDEPTVGIDPVLRRDFWQEFLRLQAQGVSIIITTHVMDEAEHCNRLGLVRDGKMMALNTPEALKTQTGASTIEEAFLCFGGVTL